VNQVLVVQVQVRAQVQMLDSVGVIGQWTILIVVRFAVLVIVGFPLGLGFL